MDDYTWRKKLENRRRRRRFERLFVVFLFALSIGCLVAYFAVYTKTPVYAMNEAFNALKKNDAETFRNRIDFDSVTAGCYDDLTGDMFKNDTRISAKERSLFENFYVLIRPQICRGMIKVMNEKLDGGKWTLPEGILKGRQLGIDFDLLLERSLIRHTTVVNIEKVEHLGTGAVAEVKIVEDYSQVPFTLKVTLENTGGKGIQIAGREFQLFGKIWKFEGMSFSFSANEWKIISVDNYKEYLESVAPILMRDVQEYIDATAEIVTRYNSAFRSEQNNFIYLQRTPGGIMSDAQRGRIAEYITTNIIPTLENRRAELDSINVPKGALYLATLRRESTDITIRAWESYRRGLIENNSAAFATAESLHKQELILDQRIEEIVHKSAVAQNLPELP